MWIGLQNTHSLDSLDKSLPCFSANKGKFQKVRQDYSEYLGFESESDQKIAERFNTLLNNSDLSADELKSLFKEKDSTEILETLLLTQKQQPQNQLAQLATATMEKPQQLQQKTFTMDDWKAHFIELVIPQTKDGHFKIDNSLTNITVCHYPEYCPYRQSNFEIFFYSQDKYQ